MVLLGCSGLVLVSVLMLIGLVVKLAARESPFLPGLDASVAPWGGAARLGGCFLGEAAVDALGARAAWPASMGIKSICLLPGANTSFRWCLTIPLRLNAKA